MQNLPPNLTDDLRVVLQHARRESEQRHNVYLDVEHLMLGLLRHTSGTAYNLFQQAHVDTNALYEQVADAVGMERPTPISLKGTARDAAAALDRMQDIARELGHVTLDTGHLMLRLLSEDSGAVHEAFVASGLTLEDAYAFVRAQDMPRVSAPANMPQSSPHRPSVPNPAITDNDEIILVPTRQTRRPKPAAPGTKPSTFAIPNGVWIVGALIALFVYMLIALPGNKMFTFIFVLVGWIFSVSLHEFSHALVAYIGGDYTVKEKGYLTFNPLKYTHPLVSIGLPLLFLAMGGIGLPGGAVYIERHRLRNKWWGAAVAAAGPAANLLLAILLGLPFLLGVVDIDAITWKVIYGQEAINTGLAQDVTIWTSVAFLMILQISAVLFNLLPIPPLDGFNILEPFLDPQTRHQLAVIGFSGGLMLIFFLFWVVEPLNTAFWNMIYDIAGTFDIPRWMIAEGFNNFRFWAS
jgi:Zn-dependent protease